MNQKTEFEIQEEEDKQKAIDITERSMLAQQYEKQMEDDDIRDGNDGGASGFKVVVD